MKLPDGQNNNASEPKEQGLRERSNKLMLQRKRQLRAKMILLNSAVALIVIMIVMICKVVSLSSQDSINTPYASEDNIKQDEGNDEHTDETEEESKNTSNQTASPATTSVPAAPAQAQPSGANKWIRQDLDKSKPMVALTFDDGPYTPVTKKILSTLKKNDAKATFFCVGSRIPQYAESVQDAYSQGCQIASHTYGHVILTDLKAKTIKEQIDKTNEVLQSAIGCQSTVLRPPGGLVNKKVCNAVDVPMICWTVDSEDWKSRNKKKILKQCNNIKDGDIVLMHDLYSSTAAAVEKLVPRLKKKGFLMVTVDELFYYKGMELEQGKVYYSAR